MKEDQCTNTILMVRPANFGFNPETAENNVFQNAETTLSSEEIKSLAKGEFDGMVKTLRSHGVEVIVIEDTFDPVKTDAVFPNNWISTHHDSSVYLFPMFSPNRRLERRKDIQSGLEASFEIRIDSSMLKFEKDAKYLEGTGSMILDRPNKIIYACYSDRTHPEPLNDFGRKIGYKVVGFNALDEKGVPYYHTNVIMTVGTHITIICTESIENRSEKENLYRHLKETGKIIVEINRDQVQAFAGNMLEIKGSDAKNLILMSTSAFQSLQDIQLNIIKKYNKIVHLPLGTIEQFGGGSARCMIAEIFLPKRNQG